MLDVSSFLLLTLSLLPKLSRCAPPEGVLDSNQVDICRPAAADRVPQVDGFALLDKMVLVLKLFLSRQDREATQVLFPHVIADFFALAALLGSGAFHFFRPSPCLHAGRASARLSDFLSHHEGSLVILCGIVETHGGPSSVLRGWLFYGVQHLGREEA